MSVSIDIYSENEEKTRRIALDVRADVLAQHGVGSSTAELEYYLTFQSSAVGLSGTIPVKIIRGLDLAPNGDPASYSTITEMVNDYTKWFSEQIDFSR